MPAWIACALTLLLPASAFAATARALYEKGAPSVVVVVAGSGQKGGPVSVGSGSVIVKAGLVLTKFHVIAPDDRPARSLRVFFKPAQLTGSLERDLTDGTD